MPVDTVHIPGNGYRWTVLLLAWLSYMSVCMIRMAVSPLSPFIVGDLRLTLTEVGLLTSASATGYMLAQIPAGWLVDKMGVRKMLFVGTFTAGIFALVVFLAQNFIAITVILFLAGLGGGCFPTVAMKAIVQWFQMKERGTAIGINQTSGNIGGIITASTLPAIATFAGWRLGFIAMGVFNLVLAVLVYALYKEPTKRDNKIVSMSAKGASWEEMRQVLLDRNILLISFSCLALTTVEFSLIAYLVIYLRGVIELTVATAAGFLALANAGGAVGKPFFGIISDRVFNGSRKKPLLVIGVLTAVSSTLMQVVSNNTPYIVLAIICMIFGFGAIGWAGLNLVFVSEFASKEMTGFAVGLSVTIALLGNIAGPPIFGLIVDSMSSYSPAWWFLTASSIASLLMILPVEEVNKKIMD